MLLGVSDPTAIYVRSSVNILRHLNINVKNIVYAWYGYLLKGTYMPSVYAYISSPSAWHNNCSFYNVNVTNIMYNWYTGCAPIYGFRIGYYAVREYALIRL